MPDALTKMLSTRDWILADGATGTTLFNMGLSSGDSPEFWNVDRPDDIRALYSGPVQSGSDLFLTNTFGGNAARLKLHDGQDRVRELNRAGAELGREVADTAGRPIIVAGSMGPTGEVMAPLGALTHELAVEMFHEQAEGLKEGGVDVLWVETISAPEEYRAAAEAAALVDMPFCGTMSFDTAGRTMMGTTSEEMVKIVGKMKHAPWPSAQTAASARPICCAPFWVSSRLAHPAPSSPRATQGFPSTSTGTSTTTARQRSWRTMPKWRATAARGSSAAAAARRRSI